MQRQRGSRDRFRVARWFICPSFLVLFDLDATRCDEPIQTKEGEHMKVCAKIQQAIGLHEDLLTIVDRRKCSGMQSSRRSGLQIGSVQFSLD